QVVETVALGVVGLTADDGSDQLRQRRCIHLTVAVHFHDHVRTCRGGGQITRHDRTADAKISLIEMYVDARVAAMRLHVSPRSIRANVIDDVDAMHKIRHASDHVEHGIAYAKARHHHGDMQHGFWANASRSRQAAYR